MTHHFFDNCNQVCLNYFSLILKPNWEQMHWDSLGIMYRIDLRVYQYLNLKHNVIVTEKHLINRYFLVLIEISFNLFIRKWSNFRFMQFYIAPTLIFLTLFKTLTTFDPCIVETSDHLEKKNQNYLNQSKWLYDQTSRSI